MQEKFTILIVDDDPERLLANARLLKSADYVTIEAGTGAEALEKAKAEKPDLVLLEVMLTDIDGVGVCKRISGDKDLAGLHVILISSRQQTSDDQSEGLESGADGYILRPIDERAFLARIESSARIIRTERALRKSEEKYRILLEESPDPIFSFTPEGQYQYVNRAFAEGLGKPLQEIIGKKIWDIFPKEEADKRFAALSQVFHTGEKQVVEGSVPRADGNRYYVTTIMPIRDTKGAVCSAICSSKDMSERKKAETQLYESEERYRTILNEMEEGYQEVDLAGNFTFFNEAFLRIFGYSRDELMGTNFRRYAAEEGIAKNVYRAYSQMYKTGISIKSLEWDIIRKDGARRTLEFFASLLKDANGRPTGFRGIVRDITERRWAENALQESRRQLSDIIEFLPDATLVIDGDGRVMAWNRAIEAMTGIKKEDILGKGNREYALPFYGERKPILIDLALNSDPEREKQYTAIQRTGDVIFGESYTPSLPGGKVHLSATASVLRDSKGKIIAAIECIRDNTERKRLEKDRQQSMERLRKSLGGTVQAIASMVETRDPYTAGHQRRVADLARTIATEMGLANEQIDGLRVASTIHDIGKISVPAEILSMPRKLTEIEFSLIKTHAQSGYDILKDIDFPWPIARMVLEHHERMDGSGYPNGLTGDKLLLESRILAVADVVESMGSHRPYRPTLGLDKALEEIAKNRGALYDPMVVDACLRLFKEKEYRLVD